MLQYTARERKKRKKPPPESTDLSDNIRRARSQCKAAQANLSHASLQGDLYHRRTYRLGSLVTDEGDNHAVKVEEEHHEVEGQLDEGFL